MNTEINAISVKIYETYIGEMYLLLIWFKLIIEEKVVEFGKGETWVRGVGTQKGEWGSDYSLNWKRREGRVGAGDVDHCAEPKRNQSTVWKTQTW